MKIRKELLNADKIFQEASSNLSFSKVNPINEPYVRRRFLSNKVKNPELKYEPPIKGLLDLRRKVSSINIDEKNALDTLMIEKQHDIIRKIDLLNSIGCFDFTERSVKLYGTPDKRLVNKAYDILNEKVKKTKPVKISSKESVKFIKNNIKSFGLKYKVLKKDLVTSCLIHTDKKEFLLKKHHRYSKKFLNRLVVHEIGTHTFRYENGALQKLNIFKNGLSNYLETEEGLAAYNEERFGLLTKTNFRNYAGRVISVHTAQENGFYKTFRELKRYFQKKTAFQLTLRSKRGIANTEFAGGYTKDLVYLKGYFQVKNFIKKGGKLKDLYYGKINCNDLKYIKKIKLKKPELLPDKFDLFEFDDEPKSK
ncbi:DUF1704 domain-containing protein [Candidatus Woesearchaeota archaeon]|nr:DUF1704 domain-containing protein [Candidatus Woesearchaeota archaeon]